MMHPQGNPQSNDSPIPRMARTRNLRCTYGLPDVNQQEVVSVHHQQEVVSVHHQQEEKKIGREPTRAETFGLCFAAEKGEARQVMETMRGLTNELDDPSQDVVTRNDVFSKANGPEKARRLRTYGHGVTPTDLCGEIPSCRACFRMIQTLTERLDTVELRTTQQNMNDISSLVDSDLPSSSSYEQRIPTLEINNPRPLRVNCSVALLSTVDRKEIVVKGFLKSMEPSNLSWSSSFRKKLL
ncbi:hypothetical protein BUALT_Bualt12G0003100 [Buddleja alternifolia]|uniref:Uncharacterized protein n=1 Tax=Buddleja alternifolia TaxID=168488 RepID=A0AAV6WVY7_9LAMI|nr:hypothetical protein BUALT_Bualt12G0003100 [Buddleja alternifolia]